MELKPGYKQTEVGVIPEEWNVVPLSRTARRITRGASPRPIDSPLWFDEESGVGWVRISDVTRSHRYLEETAQRLSDAGIRNSRFVRSGGLIMSICATVGRPIETRLDACIHDGFVVFEQPQINQSFLYHALVDLEQTWFRRGQTGSQMNLNTGLINRRLVAIPRTEAEQRAIATALTDVDALLDGLDRLIAKKRDLKRAAMQQLLTGETRLPGFSGEWEVKRLSEIASIRNQKVLPSNVGIDTPCVELDHIGQGNGRLLGCSIAQNSKSPKYRFFSGDVLFGRLRSYLRKFWHADRAGICTTEIWPLMTDSQQADSSFLHAIVQSDRFIEAASISYGTHMPRADWGVMRNFEVRLPRVREQLAIAEILSDMDADLATLEAKRNKTRDLKQAMMQELLTGKTRLVPAGGTHA